MYYSQFSKKLRKSVTGMEIRESLHYFSSVVERTVDNVIIIDGNVTEFKTLSEAKNHVKFSNQADDIISTLNEDFYSEHTIAIADIIKEEHNIKVTNNIIEQYVKLASDKTFSVDPVVVAIREKNEFDTIINGKIHYILEDNSVIAITAETQQTLNTLLENKLDVIEFMKESSDNFLKILNVIIKE